MKNEQHILPQKTGPVSLILFFAGITAFIAVTLLTSRAARDMSVSYRQLREADLSDTVTAEITYDDHMYATVLYGVELVSGDTAGRDSFLRDTAEKTLRRALAAGVTYTMVISTLFALFLYERFVSRRKVHSLAVSTSVLLIYAAYISAVLYLFRKNDLPIHLGTGISPAPLLASIVAVMGGNAFLGLVLRYVKPKSLTAILAVPLVFFCFLFGFMSEAGLFSSEYVDSFDCVILSEEYEQAQSAYYDEDKDVLVVDGKEYPPEQVPNPDRSVGLSRLGALAFEIIWPYSGNPLGLVSLEPGWTVPHFALLLYIFKGIMWMGLPSLIKDKKRT